MSENSIECALCGLVCSMQISASHLRVAHQMTTKEYRALGHQTLSPARLEQLRRSPVGSGAESGVRGKYGTEHWNWNGGHVNRQGYRIVYRNGRRMTEHRAIAEDMIGRPLAANEVVHHIDGNRQNNDPSNLQVMTNREHDQLKDGTRDHFHTNQDCEDAARTLIGLGWSKSKVIRALRIHHNTLERWLRK